MKKRQRDLGALREFKTKFDRSQGQHRWRPPDAPLWHFGHRDRYAKRMLVADLRYCAGWSSAINSRCKATIQRSSPDGLSIGWHDYFLSDLEETPDAGVAEPESGLRIWQGGRKKKTR
jgi:hypothetical protein